MVFSLGRAPARADATAKALPAAPHLIPLAAWISGIGAALSPSAAPAGLAGSVRLRGKSLGTGHDDQRNDRQKLLHTALLFRAR